MTSIELLKNIQEEYDWERAIFFKGDFETIEQDLDKLENIKSKTHLLYGQREAIAKEYIDWCEKNKAVLTDPTNMVTWFLTVKLKEWLENDK